MEKKAIIDAYIAIKKAGCISDDVLEFLYTNAISCCEQPQIVQPAANLAPPQPTAPAITPGPPVIAPTEESSVQSVPVQHKAAKIKSFDEFHSGFSD